MVGVTLCSVQVKTGCQCAGVALPPTCRRPRMAKVPVSSNASASPRVCTSMSPQVTHPLTGVLSPNYISASHEKLRKHNEAGPNTGQLNQTLKSGLGPTGRKGYPGNSSRQWAETHCTIPIQSV